MRRKLTALLKKVKLKGKIQTARRERILSTYGGLLTCHCSKCTSISSQPITVVRELTPWYKVLFLENVTIFSGPRSPQRLSSPKIQLLSTFLKDIKSEAIPVTESHFVLTIGSQMTVRSVPRTSRALLPRHISSLCLRYSLLPVRGSLTPRQVGPEGLSKLIKFNFLIGSWTRDLRSIITLPHGRV
jgi:hypothetical protein